MLNQQSILITGGSGFFGQNFVRYVLKKYPDIGRVIIFSRDELKHFAMSQDEVFNDPRIEFAIGDIRDLERLKKVSRNVDFIVHAAALKQVSVAEKSPYEFIKTNIIGSHNVIEASIENNVSKVVSISTEKASSPAGLYGATKLCSDKLFTSQHNHSYDNQTTFSVVRYGNVMGSTGSVIPFFLRKREEGKLPITDEKMTRFNITSNECSELVLTALEKSIGGEIFVPKLPSFNITDLSDAISPNALKRIIGIRPGEKLHEEMISTCDASRTIDVGPYFVITPNDSVSYQDHHKGVNVKPGFSYSSESNDDWMTVELIRELIRKHIDPDFEPL
ncbi:MAG: UDP-N-acetylglucosamine 4,6-dehydratase (inverting) [Cyclobacteriaceae bacterium]